jgi:hypothetical protein
VHDVYGTWKGAECAVTRPGVFCSTRTVGLSVSVWFGSDGRLQWRVRKGGRCRVSDVFIYLGRLDMILYIAILLLMKHKSSVFSFRNYLGAFCCIASFISTTVPSNTTVDDKHSKRQTPTKVAICRKRSNQGKFVKEKIPFSTRYIKWRPPTRSSIPHHHHSTSFRRVARHTQRTLQTLPPVLKPPQLRRDNAVCSSDQPSASPPPHPTTAANDEAAV